MTVIRPEEMVHFRVLVPSEYKDKLIDALISVGAVHLDPHAYRLELSMPKLFSDILEKRVSIDEINIEKALEEARRYLPRDDPLVVELAKLCKEYSDKLFLKKVVEVLKTLKIEPRVFSIKEKPVVLKLYIGEKELENIESLKKLKAVINAVKVNTSILLIVAYRKALEKEVENELSKQGFSVYKLPEYCYTTSENALENIEKELVKIKARAFDVLKEIASLIKSSIELEYATRLEILEKAYNVCRRLHEELDTARNLLTAVMSLDLAMRLSFSKNNIDLLAKLNFSQSTVDKVREIVEKGLIALEEKERTIFLSQFIGDLELLKEEELKERLKDRYDLLKMLSLAMIIKREVDNRYLEVAEALNYGEITQKISAIEKREIPAKKISLREELMELSEVTEEAEESLKKLAEISSKVDFAKLVEEKDLSKIIVEAKEVLANFTELAEELISRESFLEACIKAESLVGELRIFRQKRVIYAIGWIPKKYASMLETTIKSRVPRIIYLKTRKPRVEDKPPVYLRHKGPLKYFVALTLARGIPSYWEIDPTLFFTILFTLMYGLMFGDVGLGAIIAGLGAYLYITRKEVLGMNKEQVAVLGVLMIFCGLSAVFFGVLYGVAFLKEVWEPIFLSPIHDLEGIIATALIFGVIQLLLAMTLSVVNKVLSHDYIGALLGGTGVAGIMYYSAGVYIAYNIIEHGFDLSAALLPEVLPATIIAVLSIFLVLASGFLEKIIEKKEEGLMHSIVELMEMIIAYPANSLSYIRLAAFAIAHEIFGVLAETMAHMINPLASFLFANVIVLGIEGFAVGIQALRLVYYEFSTKFFEGEGMLYEPLEIAPEIKTR